MRLTRIHVPGELAAGSEITLPAQAAEHLTRVLRLEAGAPLTVFNGRGGEYSAVLATRKGKTVTARLGNHDAIDRESPLDITLLQGVARGERMDLIVQKATELGVTRIVPVLAERTVVKVDAKQRERKLVHWQSVAISACEQCGRNRVPEILAPLALEQYCRDAAPGNGILLSAEARIGLREAAPRLGKVVTLAAGPESGFTAREEALLAQAGFLPVRLGPRVLRTETAALAALAALNALAGDF